MIQSKTKYWMRFRLEEKVLRVFYSHPYCIKYIIWKPWKPTIVASGAFFPFNIDNWQMYGGGKVDAREPKLFTLFFTELLQ